MKKKAKTPMKKEKENFDSFSRRKFIINSSLSFAAFSIIPRHVMGKGFIAPSDKINLGVIGLGKQGNILSDFFVSQTQAQIVAGSDVWDNKRESFKNNIDSLYAKQRNITQYKGVNTYLDYQELLNRSDIDAVIVATPDHWHAIQSIDAMNKGKDVFCEKPLTNTISEGRAIADAVTKTKSVFQTGSMQRSWQRFILAQEIVSSGKLGEITKVLVNVGDPARPYDLAEETLPKGVDWNRWCGPAPVLGYNDIIAPKIVKTYPGWRDFKEVGSGRIGDWGAHMFDIAQWCLGMDHTGPVTYIPPNDKKAVRGLKMYYENGIEMVHEDFGRGWGVRFIGSKGSMDVSRDYLETKPENILAKHTKLDLKTIMNMNGNHYQNWLDGIKTREQPICDAEIGHRTATIANIANMAYELGITLGWDPKKEKFLNSKQANNMRKRRPRKY